MANVIDFANASQTIDYIAETNQLAQASGWDMSTAVQNLNPEVASNGMRLVGFEAQAGAEAVTEFSAANAPDAFASYIESGGLEAASGAAAAGTSIGAGTVALASSSAVPTGVVGVAAGSAGLACAAAAPIFGVAAGVGLYELAPDFWTQVSQALLPWVWEGLDIMPVAFDEDGRTYLPVGAIEALRPLLEAQTSYPPHTTTGSYTIHSIGNLSALFSSWMSHFQEAQPGIVLEIEVAASNVIDNFLSTYANNVGMCSWVYTTGSGTSQLIGVNVNRQVGQNFGDIGDDYFYCTHYLNIAWHTATVNDVLHLYITGANVGTNANMYIQGKVGVGENFYYRYGYRFSACNIDMTESYPEGFEQWTGEAYPANPNTINVLTGFDEQGNPLYEPYQQVALPIGDPLVTNDPAVQPSPYTNPLPEVNPDTGTKVYPAIDPYVNPKPSPNEFPLPNDIPEGEPGHIGDPNLDPAPLPSVEDVPLPATETVPDPAVDPSAEPVPDAEPANPIQPAGPTSGGSSPTPTIPVFPPFPDGNASLYHVYNPTNAQLQQFGSWLWTTFSGNLIDTLSKLFNNPMDAVISLQEFYYTPNIQGQGTIRCGYLDSEVPSALVGNRYSTLNCGSIIIPEYWGNYLDYSPYSQVIVYLPFIGFMSLNADDVIGNAVNITYHIDSYTGSVIAIITVARQGYESVVYQFEGNCSVDVPVTGGQQSAIKGAIIGGISGAVMGGVPGAVAGAVLGGLSTKNDVQHSGSFSSSYGAMGAKVPFIVVRRPIQKVVYNYNESYGFPAHKMVYVGNCRGYLRAREVRVLSTTATNEEKAMITEYLLSGVYVKN